MLFRSVDEFSSFARMPKPEIGEGDLRAALKEAVFLQKVAHPEIRFRIDLGDDPLHARFDERMIGQAFTNLVKNAAEAIEGHDYEGGETPFIEVSSRLDGERVVVEIIDNGKGLPVENRARLLEPYMTTRAKGTGLGLAIVSKILEEHGATLELLDAPQVADGGHGAMVRVAMPSSTAAQPSKSSAERPEGADNPGDDHGV